MHRYIRLLSIVVVLVLSAAFAFVLWPHEPLPRDIRADLILVDKSDRTLSLVKDGAVFRTYRIALGAHPHGHKLQEGDERTPEGRYEIDGRNAGSRFFRSLHISYPNATDRNRAAESGVSPGGDIMIHGMKNGFGWLGRLHRLVDWTNGCIAVTDEEMRDIWSAVATGTAIEIRG